jgi:hypothetical protein
MAMDSKITIWIHSHEKERWEEAAKTEGRNLSNFIRYHLNIRAVDHLGPSEKNPVADVPPSEDDEITTPLDW